MKPFHYLSIFILFSLINCINYDLHPNLLKGTTFHIKDQPTDSFNKSRIFYTATKFNGGEIKKVEKVRIDEYYFLSFYTGRTFGTYKNGSLVDILEKEIQNVEIEENEYFLFEINNIEYKSNAYYDLLNDFLPGGFIRYNNYQMYYTLKIISKKEFIQIASIK
ncbi:hypothetical protein [Leptospira vanthielii]|uniref:Uncharacterized protein n=1 Tax=Leptospira vanthielii serovar Holland str. Waz Holland = ATCC 700522 TaxID=1218591 RepID=N1WD94_9LEPT|nr:hypothetical protein [Leptospira vanthielii]EMY69846.1 hypothetical protein LEP1GSC199_1630 [Leptospira vanthielii serovar Holland str. Waz Holland = ATCC 700522]